MSRVVQREVVLYEDFPSDAAFHAVQQHASDRGALCFAHLPSRRIAVRLPVPALLRAPPFIPQQSRGIIEAKRLQSLYNESCDHSASIMLRTCCGIKGGARVTNCDITHAPPPPPNNFVPSGDHKLIRKFLKRS
jgi:hypothetical protein